MTGEGRDIDPSGGGRARLATTHWSVMQAAEHTGSRQAVEALENLCRTYWLLREEIAQTVGSPEEVEDELRYLLAVVPADAPSGGMPANDAMKRHRQRADGTFCGIILSGGAVARTSPDR